MDESQGKEALDDLLFGLFTNPKNPISTRVKVIIFLKDNFSQTTLTASDIVDAVMLILEEEPPTKANLPLWDALTDILLAMYSKI